MLPICFGEATKFAQFLLNADKYYRVTAYLGRRTTTCDSEGGVIEERDISGVSEKKVDYVLKQFRGEIFQIPSMFSAIKHKGTPLYKFARRGIELDRKPRRIIIHELKKISFKKNELMLEVRCSKGTYIRNLVDDIGMMLGCGAYVLSLRRLESGNFNSAQMYTFDNLVKYFGTGGFFALDKLLLEIDSMCAILPKIVLDMLGINSLYCGRSVTLCMEKTTSGLVRLVDESNRFFGVGQIFKNDLGNSSILRVKRLLQKNCRLDGFKTK